jgi:protein-tyrosine phosphatase
LAIGVIRLSGSDDTGSGTDTGWAGKTLTAARRRAGVLARTVLAGADRALHPLLHRKTAAQIQSLAPHGVLILCFGNICRSPYAERALAKTLAGSSIVVTSAGFFGPDRPAPDAALAAAADFGIDLRTHRSKLLTAAMLESHDLIVVVEPAQRRTLVREWNVPARRIIILGDLDPGPIPRRMIADPYGGSPDVFSECYQRIQRSVDKLATLLQP